MAVRRLILFATLVGCLVLASTAGADSYTFNAPFQSTGQGFLTFTGGAGDSLTIGAGNGGNGALITDFFNTQGICGGDCSIVGGYIKLTSGGETMAFASGGSFSYTFGAGGSEQIFGKIPSLGINSSTLLFSASFLPGATFAGSTLTGVGSYASNINTNSIVLNAALGKYHYISGSGDDLSFSITGNCGTSTIGTCQDAINQSVNMFVISEPATLSVLGVGLFAFGTGLRRKMPAGKSA